MILYNATFQTGKNKILRIKILLKFRSKEFEIFQETSQVFIS